MHVTVSAVWVTQGHCARHGCVRLWREWSTTGLQLVYDWSTTGLRLVYDWSTTGPRLVYDWSTTARMGMVETIDPKLLETCC